ncbi:unnamed protein product [Linum trigynum]|uniref:Uncharacterized protein n=1 Tax=Linum trigynum TaxID=586398 RepID=A0AAV2E4Y5_9ROSI
MRLIRLSRLNPKETDQGYEEGGREYQNDGVSWDAEAGGGANLDFRSGEASSASIYEARDVSWCCATSRGTEESLGMDEEEESPPGSEGMVRIWWWRGLDEEEESPPGG